MLRSEEVLCDGASFSSKSLTEVVVLCFEFMLSLLCYQVFDDARLLGLSPSYILQVPTLSSRRMPLEVLVLADR
jgi:hypothetical protein